MFVATMFTLLLGTSLGAEIEVKKHEQEFENGNWAPFEDSNVKGLLENTTSMNKYIYVYYSLP